MNSFTSGPDSSTVPLVHQVRLCSGGSPCRQCLAAPLGGSAGCLPSAGHSRDSRRRCALARNSGGAAGWPGTGPVRGQRGAGPGAAPPGAGRQGAPRGGGGAGAGAAGAGGGGGGAAPADSAARAGLLAGSERAPRLSTHGWAPRCHGAAGTRWVSSGQSPPGRRGGPVPAARSCAHSAERAEPARGLRELGRAAPGAGRAPGERRPGARPARGARWAVPGSAARCPPPVAAPGSAEERCLTGPARGASSPCAPSSIPSRHPLGFPYGWDVGGHFLLLLALGVSWSVR